MHPLLAEQAHRAQQILAPDAFAYYSAGAGAELTAGEAEGAWSRYRLRPHVLRDVSSIDVSTTVLGQRLANPIGLAPTAYHHLAHSDAESASAAGVAAAGGLFVLSSRSSQRIEQVAAESGPWWFQVYVMRDRGITRSLVERAKAAGARALVLTGDTPYVAAKYRSAAPPVSDEVATIKLADAVARIADERFDWTAIEQDPAIGLDAIGWLAEVSGLPVVVKGVLRGDDARECVSAGARGLIVSAHGGRQTDRAVPSAQALPEVVDAVDGTVEVYVDGGIRSGTDAAVAVALGARAVFVGRPGLYALAAGGGAGVTTMLGTLADELRQVLGVAGFASPAALSRDDVVTGTTG